METKKDHPGVYFPPPFLYVVIFLFSLLLEKLIDINSFFELTRTSIASLVFLIAGFAFMLPALIKFFQTKNTLIPTKPATSLETSGIYSFSRNPMYLGLLLIYIGLAFLFGNWWTFILVPILIILVNKLIIIKEERYLERSFGPAYIDYRKKVRRWI
jgi:protein-S-isoprenylcysteine O-methyltransferase Ste14